MTHDEMIKEERNRIWFELLQHGYVPIESLHSIIYDSPIPEKCKPQPKTVPWDFEDYLEHADCWYKREFSPIFRIERFGQQNMFFEGAWYTDYFPAFYSPTPNGVFLPCVKEVQL